MKDMIHGTTAFVDLNPMAQFPLPERPPAAPLPKEHDPINHPKHYTSHPSGIECIEIVEHCSFNVGNAIKYLIRREHKGSAVENLKKAAWYTRRELIRRGGRPQYRQAPPLTPIKSMVNMVVECEPCLSIGAAIGLLAIADWSEDWKPGLSAAAEIIDLEIGRLEGKP